MSLVNDMLRDLDGRRASSEAVGGDQSLAPAQKTQKKRGLGGRWIFLLVAVAATAAVLSWLLPRGRETQINRDYTSQQVATQRTVERPSPLPGEEPLESADDDRLTGGVLGADSSDSSNSSLASLSSASSATSLAASSETSSAAPASSGSPAFDESEEPSAARGISQAASREPDSSPAQTRSAEPAELQPNRALAQSDANGVPGESAGNAAAGLMKQSQIATTQTEDDSNLVRVPAQAEAQVGRASEEVADESVLRRSTEMSVTQLDVVNVQEALALLAGGQEREAFAMLQDYVTATPGAHRSRETLVKLLLSRSELEQAFLLVDAGLALAPNHQGFKKAKARLLIAGNNPSAAAELLMTRAPEASSDIEYYELLTSTQLAAGDYDGAARNYRQLLQVDSTQARWWYGFALSQDRLGNSSSAKQAYEQALQGTALSANLRRAGERRLRELQ